MAKVLIATVKPFSAEAVEAVKSVFQEAGFEVEVLSKYPEQSDLVAALIGMLHVHPTRCVPNTFLSLSRQRSNYNYELTKVQSGYNRHVILSQPNIQ